MLDLDRHENRLSVSPSSSAKADDPVTTDIGAFPRNDAGYRMSVFAHNLSVVMPAKAGIQ
jgi:hypothetical protein